jgi:hypothetical protein
MNANQLFVVDLDTAKATPVPVEPGGWGLPVWR